METWNLNQITDKNFLDSLRQNAENLFGLVDLQLSDGVIRVSKRQALLNLFFWRILTHFNIPIRKDHFIKTEPINNGTLVKRWNKYYEEIMAMDQHNAKRLKQIVYETLEDLYRWCFDDLLAYVASIDIEDMALIMNDPVMRKEIDSKNEIEKMGKDTSRIEKFIEDHRVVIMNMLGTKGALSHETLLPYQRIGLLNKFQVPQTMYAFGVRTDVNDNIVTKPVIGSAIDGLRDIQEFAVEALSAKKSMFYNQNSVSSSQYFGRKQHLLASSVKNLYKGDCGCSIKNLIKFDVTPANSHNLVGKVIWDTDHYVTLTDSNIKNYEGKTIHMRSPMTCRYKDGVCEVCGGQVLGNVNRKVLIGILCAIHMIEPVTQMILSTKHLIKTLSLVYAIPDKALEVLRPLGSSDIRWSNAFSRIAHECKIGIPMDCFTRFDDIAKIRKDKPIPEINYSDITRFHIKRGDVVKTYDMISDSRTPFLSQEFLWFIKDHLSEKEIVDDALWIPLKGSENLTIFRTIVINDNMVEFVKSVVNFLGEPITKLTSCSRALSEFSKVIYGKVSVNIVHLELVLKAYLTTSETDSRIPVVEDPDNVRFGSIDSILSNRHVSVRLGYQAFTKYFKDPASYTRGRSKSPFDLMIGYTDY